MTPTPNFNGTPLFDVEYLRNDARYHMVTTVECDLLNCAIVDDLE